MAGRQENVQAAPLIFLNDHLGNFRIGRRADNGGKPRSGAVDKFNPAFSENGIIGSSQPDFTGFFIDILGMQIKIRLVQVAQDLSDFKRKQGGHAGVQKRPQVG